MLRLEEETVLSRHPNSLITIKRRLKVERERLIYKYFRKFVLLKVTDLEVKFNVRSAIYLKNTRSEVIETTVSTSYQVQNLELSLI